MADCPLPQIRGAFCPAALKDQAGGAVSQRSTLCPWNVAAGSPTWILLEFPQSHHPTTTAIAVTFIPASRKPVRLQKPSQLQSKWPHLPISTCHSCSLSPAGVGLPQAQVPWVLAPRTPLPAVIGLVLPWPEATVPAVFTQGLRRRGRARRNVAPARTPSLISPLLGSSGRAEHPAPRTNLPRGRGQKRSKMSGASCLKLPS